MKKIALLHTVPSVYNSFPAMLKAAVSEEIAVDSLVDEYLITESRKQGYFTPKCKEKLLLDLFSLSAQEPDLIIVTCSSLSTIIGAYRDTVSCPIVTIDKRMVEDAAAKGDRIAVLATAPTTIDPTVSSIKAEAAKLGKDVTVDAFLDEEAMNLLKKNDVAGHDRRLSELSKKVRDYDVVVLAQASMATAKDLCQANVNGIVLTSPGSCIEQAREILFG